jgi:glycosyltransferase involved in cell wall biosynthesis
MDMPVDLLEAPEVKFAPLPTHEGLPTVLAAATALLLPESFNEARQAIEYSISSKVHLYLMSGRPVLVYGPAHSGTVGYAVRGGWGLVVAERSAAKLKKALTEILFGSERVRQLRRNGDACIQRNHELAAGRERFHKILADAARPKEAIGGCSPKAV